MKVGRKSTVLALATGAALVLSACGGEGDAAPSTEPASATTELRGAPASESATAASQPPAHPTTEDPEHYAADNGGYMFTLPDGGICSIDGALNDEYGFGGKTGGDFFVAVQHVTRFWTPRPDWVPEPNFPPIG